ncbi:hypothetical protein PP175_10100 [Aneurinibacillus sp. Ricciae_BoGa-3]|uniref:hypothetical protein n=1 Tax=Aneurinibacillus sp. Ricciae_BoGa-3 TaxID=3022697 RepID=UPI00234006C9|nr:hypothetical protein [Aneurinibacillus sp. Ricciae_BoGa-3]WCK56231.1 hypothetical protein PP175_10100 [Aneurinibacillus sp. Ricciae_BoGa-3]
MSILVNDIIVFSSLDKDEKTFERVLWMDEWVTFTIDIFAEKPVPVMRRLKDIEEDLENKVAFKCVDDPYMKFLNDSEIKGKDIKIRDQRWEIVKSIAIAENEPAIYHDHIRKDLIKNAMEQHHVTNKSVWKFLRQY